MNVIWLQPFLGLHNFTGDLPHITANTILLKKFHSHHILYCKTSILASPQFSGVSIFIDVTFFKWSISNETRAVLVFVTKRKNNVDPRPRAQKKVNYVQLFFAK